MKEFLLEISTENNSHESILKYMNTLDKLFEENADNLRIPINELKVCYTAKRILFTCVIKRDIQTSQIVHVKGPAKDICYDDQGNPTYIYKKFIKQKGSKNMDVITKSINGKEYIFLTGKKQCKLISEVLQTFVTTLVSRMNISRNIKSILVIYDQKVKDLSLGEKSTSNYTFVGEKKLKVQDIKHYFQLMDENNILLTNSERIDHIEKQLRKFEENLNSKAIYTDMERLSSLSEHPTIYLSHFSQSLTLPEDILNLFLGNHPNIMFFKQGDKVSKNIGLILGGNINEKTVSKYTKSIEDKLLQIQRIYNKELENHFTDDTNSLKNVVFLEDLGTMYDKVQRVKHIAGKISDLLCIGEPITTFTKRAAELSKNDLSNPLVALYPKLHGVIGKNYAIKYGETQEVALAIEEYILPTKYQPNLPQTMAGSILSIADKIDTIVGLFSVGLHPKGNEDIYKLKAKTDGIIRIIERTQMDISLKRITNLSINLYESYHILKQKDKDKLLDDILEFFNVRIMHYLENQEFNPNIVEALVANKSTNITLITGKGEFLHEIIQSNELKDTVTIFNRLKNLIGVNPINDIELEFLTEDTEIKLHENYLYYKKNYYDKIDRGDFENAFYDLESLNYCLEKFLNEIYVYTDDEAIRQNRINMLTNIYDLYLDFCDFSKFKNKVVNN